MDGNKQRRLGPVSDDPGNPPKSAPHDLCQVAMGLVSRAFKGSIRVAKLPEQPYFIFRDNA
jgi:hypothetical protein